MKKLKTFLLAAGVAVTGLAGPLQKEQVAADAKWVIHLDLDALLATQIGNTIARESVDPKMAKAAAGLKQLLDFDFDWRRIHSLTVYGTEYTGPERLRGVLLVDSDLDVAKGFETALKKQADAGRATDGDLQRLEDGATPLYCLKEDLYVAIQPGAPLILSRARQTTLKAREVLIGGAPNLNAATVLGELPAAGAGFFCLAAARGFSDAGPVPPQARVLRMADGLRMVLGEKGDQVTASLALSAKTAEAARQMHQVLQGMIALVALSQVENPDLQTLAGGTRVGLENQTVTVDISLPVTKISQKIVAEERRKQAGN